MAMRLLSAPEGKSRRDIDNASQELRSQELDKILASKRKEINDLDAVLVRTLSENGTKNYEEEQAWKNKIAELASEVSALESRRKSALIPLEEREKSVQDRESALLQREETIVIKESDIEYTKQALEDKLDSLSEREQDVLDYSKKLANREANIKLQEIQVETRLKALTTILQESYEEIIKSQSEQAQAKAILKGRDVSISEREKNVSQQVASFENREKAIVDRYKTLLRAITETNLNNNGNYTHKRGTG